MKLVVAIVNPRDARRLRDAMVADDYRFTELGSVGGFLREGSATFLVGTGDERVDPLLELIGQHCQSREEVMKITPRDAPAYPAVPVGEGVTIAVGGAQVFVLQIERSLRV